MTQLDYQQLHTAVSGSAVGLRARTPLEPLGGPGDKVFPPTYGVDRGATTKYAEEKRRADGVSINAVVLDSVASAANSFELALLEAVRRGELTLPLVSVDFRATDAAWLDRLSALEVPHRVFDALLRDSLLDGSMFRLSEPGRAITEATPRNAGPLYRYSPTTLLFGGWDSTGPKGGRGAKYERAITSEVVAFGVEYGVKTASRIDPAGIELKAGPLYQTVNGDWALDEAEAVIEKDKPKLYARPGAEGAPGRPSQVNHGNVTPSIDHVAGGVTADRIVATTVLSFPALRRLRFPVGIDGTPLDEDHRGRVELAAHTVLAALGIAATVLAFDDGFDLRSRCVLFATEALELELINRGGTSEGFRIERADALDLVDVAVQRAADVGLTWQTEEILLTPAPRLVELIRRSRELAAAGSEE